MLNYETLLSSYDDKLTLMQWLKKVEEALKDASAVAFKVNQRGNATLTFSVEFEDGTELETGPIVLQQGESVVSAAIVGGHLKLTLTNGDVLDAGDLGGVSSFSIDASQHLIVQYQNGTTQDLGAIFTGNIAISGNLSVTGTISGKTPILNADEEEITAQKPVVEVMTGYSYLSYSKTSNINVTYAGAVKNGNKLTLVIAGTLVKGDFTSCAGSFRIPTDIGNKLYPIHGDYISAFSVYLPTSAFNLGINKQCGVSKTAVNELRFYIFALDATLADDTTYLFRIEQTFLLSENLAE